MTSNSKHRSSTSSHKTVAVLETQVFHSFEKKMQLVRS